MLSGPSFNDQRRAANASSVIGAPSAVGGMRELGKRETLYFYPVLIIYFSSAFEHCSTNSTTGTFASLLNPRFKIDHAILEYLEATGGVGVSGCAPKRSQQTILRRIALNWRTRLPVLTGRTYK
jgi:hypothetical protein